MADHNQTLDPERIYDAIYRGVRDAIVAECSESITDAINRAVGDAMPYSSLILDAVFDGVKKAIQYPVEP